MTQTPSPTGSPAPNQPAIAHGTRRDEVRYETDPDQVVQVRHTFKPDGRLAPDEHAANAAGSADPPVQDVAVAKPAPSVWEARSDGDD
jgi:hypothetical protein